MHTLMDVHRTTYILRHTFMNGQSTHAMTEKGKREKEEKRREKERKRELVFVVSLTVQILKKSVGVATSREGLFHADAGLSSGVENR